MNRLDEFDSRLARWLEEGPFEAPDRAVAAAIAHADAHPRRRLSRAALWRSAMDSLHLTPVKPERARNAGRSFAVAAGAVAVVAVAVVIGAIAIGRSGGEAPAGGGVVQPTPIVTPTPIPTPPPVAVTGVVSSTLTSSPTETVVGDVTQHRGIVFQTDTSGLSDQRLRGPGEVHVSVDVRPDGSADMWATEVITTADGAWTGTWTGIIDKGLTTHRIAAVLAGSGAYAGLQYRYTATSDDNGVTMTVTSGWIEAIPPFEPTAPVTARLPVTGTESCSDVQLVATSSVTTVGGVEQKRNAVVSCAESMDDARAWGTLHSVRVFNSDTRPDGAASWWGTVEIANYGGTWTGVWNGTVDAQGNVSIASAAIGSGGYYGLQYREAITMASQAAAFTSTGTIEPVIIEPAK